MRLVPTIVACVLSALVGVVGSAAWFLNAASDPHRPDLLANLHGDGWAGQNAAFDQRVLRIVPLGSPESELLELLKKAGFRKAWDPVGSHDQAAVWDDRDHAGFVICGAAMQVWWSVDQQDRITAFRSQYSDDGCP